MRYKWLKTAIFAVFILFVIAYALYSARHIIIGPKIILFNKENVIMQEGVITISGKIENASELRVNNFKVFVDENGYFRERFFVIGGDNVWVFTAKDKFGRKNEEILSITVLNSK